ncbi:MAG: complex I NDUFA9 subunit family protein [Woeseiaceae bacterium]
MRVAVVGATGFVGSYVVDSLLEQGHDVNQLVRPDSEHKARHAHSTLVVSGSIDSPASLNELVSGCDAVIYSVGILRENPRQGITFENTQFDGVARTVDAALANGVSRFLLLSANGVKTPGTRYQETKKRAEELLLASDLEATIFRPSVIFGDPRGRMEFATQLFRDMVRQPIPAVSFFSGLRPANGEVLMSPVHVTDVVRAIVGALGNPETVGKTYKLGGAETLSWSDMIHRIAATTGRKKWIIPVPISFMKAAATIFDFLPFFPVTRDQLTMLQEGNTASHEVIESLTGVEPLAFSLAQLDYLNID